MILSVSRRTDIPAFYFDWFLKRLKERELLVRNPMNRKQVSRILLTPDTIDCIAFWTKDATKMEDKLNQLDPYPYFIQYTINPYQKIYEKNVPENEYTVKNFKSIANKIGSHRMIWRYSPILISPHFTLDTHIKDFEKLCKELEGSTYFCRISFLEIYNKIKRKANLLGIESPSLEQQKEIVKNFVAIGKSYNIEVSGCGNMNLKEVGLKERACIDEHFTALAVGKPVKKKKDSNQRDTCFCMPSVEIGTYNTCKNSCVYCYANYNDESINNQCSLYSLDSPILCSSLIGDEKINDRKIVRLK